MEGAETDGKYTWLSVVSQLLKESESFYFPSLCCASAILAWLCTGRRSVWACRNYESSVTDLSWCRIPLVDAGSPSWKRHPSVFYFELSFSAEICQITWISIWDISPNDCHGDSKLVQYCIFIFAYSHKPVNMMCFFLIYFWINPNQNQETKIYHQAYLMRVEVPSSSLQLSRCSKWRVKRREAAASPCKAFNSCHTAYIHGH